MLAAIWGSSFLFMRISAAEFGPLPGAAVRVAIASVFLLPLLVYKGLTAELRKHWKRVFFVGLLNSGIPFACFSFALLSIMRRCRSLVRWWRGCGCVTDPPARAVWVW